MSDWRKLRELDARELGVLAASAALFPAIALALRLTTLRRTTAALGTLERARASRPLAPDRIARLSAAAARRSIVTPSCMVRSLALRVLLVRHGHDACIRFGARKEAGELLAHAWVECEGRPLLESGEGYPAFSSAGEAP